jgi:hypothetical protein
MVYLIKIYSSVYRDISSVYLLVEFRQVIYVSVSHFFSSFRVITVMVIFRLENLSFWQNRVLRYSLLMRN